MKKLILFLFFVALACGLYFLGGLSMHHHFYGSKPPTPYDKALLTAMSLCCSIMVTAVITAIVRID